MFKTFARIAATLLFAGSAVAAPVAITSYDITHTPGSGFGGWSHTYNGTIVSDGAGALNYSGGSGTLNDGVIGTDVNTNHLFQTTLNPTITLHLASLVNVGSISIFGGDNPTNTIPGLLGGLDVAVGAGSGTFAVSHFGPGTNYFGQLSNSLVNLTGSGLDTQLVDTIVLSNFTGTAFDFYLSITEITVDGAAGIRVPEPGTLALLGAALVAASLRRRRTA
jgi:PEP-CTERM motif